MKALPYYKEEWKDIEGFEGLYQASNFIKVMNVRTGKILKPDIANGYYRVVLCKNGKAKHYLLHRIIAQAFIPNPENLPVVDHINTFRTDCRVENLKWTTHTGNHRNPLSLEHLSNANKGKHHTPEAKEKMRQAKLGKPNTHSFKKIKQLTLNNELIKVWDCIKDACSELNIPPSNISNCLYGKSKSAGGYHWELV